MRYAALTIAEASSFLVMVTLQGRRKDKGSVRGGWAVRRWGVRIGNLVVLVPFSVKVFSREEKEKKNSRQGPLHKTGKRQKIKYRKETSAGHRTVPERLGSASPKLPAPFPTAHPNGG